MVYSRHARIIQSLNCLYMKENGQPQITATSMNDELMKIMVANIEQNTKAIANGTVEITALKEPVEALKGVDGRLGSLETEVGTLKDKIEALLNKPDAPVGLITCLREDLKKHTDFFEKPTRKEIHHRHFLGWPFRVLIALLLLCSGAFALMIYSRQQADEYRGNDLKWRYMNLIRSPALHSLLDTAQNKYLQDPEGFRRFVIEQEQVEQELTEKRLEVDQKNQEIENLKKKQKDN